MSNPRHSEAYVGKRDRLLIKGRLIERFKASKYFDPEPCTVSRMVASFPQPPSGSPTMYSPPHSFRANTSPATSRFDAALSLLKKDVLEMSSHPSPQIPVRDVYENKRASEPSDVTYAVCRGMLLRQLETFEPPSNAPSKTATVVAAQPKGPTSSKAEIFCSPFKLNAASSPDLATLYSSSLDDSDAESIYTDDLSSPTDEIFLPVPDPDINAHKSHSSRSSSRTEFEPYRPDSSTSTLYPDLLEDCKRALSPTSLALLDRTLPPRPHTADERNMQRGVNTYPGSVPPAPYSNPFLGSERDLPPRPQSSTSEWSMWQKPLTYPPSIPPPPPPPPPPKLATDIPSLPPLTFATLTSPPSTIFVPLGFSPYSPTPARGPVPSRSLSGASASATSGHRHTASDPISPSHCTLARNFSYSEFSGNPYRQSIWTDDGFEEEEEGWQAAAAELGFSPVAGLMRQDTRLTVRKNGTVSRRGTVKRQATLRRAGLEGTGGMLKRGGTKRATSYQGVGQMEGKMGGLQRQDTIAAFLDNYLDEGEEVPAVPRMGLMPLRVVTKV